MEGQIHVGDVIPLNISLSKPDYKVIDLSGTSSISLIIQRPDGSRLTKTPIKTTDGTDGKIYIIFDPTDLNMDGEYLYQVWANWLDGKIRHSKVVSFQVYPNL